MEIEKIYTKTMHKALQNALRNKFRIDYEPQGGFIKFLYNTCEGVVFKFNTCILSVGAIEGNSFLSMQYDKIIDDLKENYKKTQTNNLYSLESEFKDRIKF
jgi:hypothetical protein